MIEWIKLDFKLQNIFNGLAPPNDIFIEKIHIKNEKEKNLANFILYVVLLFSLFLNNENKYHAITYWIAKQNLKRVLFTNK